MPWFLVGMGQSNLDVGLLKLRSIRNAISAGRFDDEEIGPVDWAGPLHSRLGVLGLPFGLSVFSPISSDRAWHILRCQSIEIGSLCR